MIHKDILKLNNEIIQIRLNLTEKTCKVLLLGSKRNCTSIEWHTTTVECLSIKVQYSHQGMWLF